jgi:hypothetical protein
MELKIGQHVAIILNNYTTRFGTIVNMFGGVVTIQPNDKAAPLEVYTKSKVYPSSEYEARNPNPYR